jgi:hypothetical protein
VGIILKLPYGSVGSGPRPDKILQTKGLQLAHSNSGSYHPSIPAVNGKEKLDVEDVTQMDLFSNDTRRVIIHRAEYSRVAWFRYLQDKDSIKIENTVSTQIPFKAVGLLVTLEHKSNSGSAAELFLYSEV